MNGNNIKTIICLILTGVMLIMTFTTDDVMYSQLFASLGIICGVAASHQLYRQNINNYD